MVFGLFKRKDPICGMKEEKGKGMEHSGKWFCSEPCLKHYKEAVEKSKSKEIGGCCHK